MQFVLLQRSRAARCIPGNQLQGMQLECNPRAARVPPFCHHRYRGTSLRLSTMKVLLYGIITLKKQVFRNLFVILFRVYICVFYYFFFSSLILNIVYDEL